ncbi:PhoH family protein [Schleiferiaceae bacterium]|jgi:phosphate starvation-inducible PhoH-like protein|nr:PhoH family protein [Schleiferiaceae bacterium]MDA9151156.1 PhoH family protein [Schleiferiaceae bacterium]MDC3353538.1 PhoH family protein [Schleiferiaceae bacterium]
MERIVHIENMDPQILFGANNARMRQLKDYFPKLKVTARGEMIKWEGTESDVTTFEEKLDLIFRHIERFNVLTEAQLERIVLDDKPSILKNLNGHNDVIVNGVGGLLIKARTANQRKMVEAVDHNDLVFAMGPAGTGKTYTAVALAVRALKNKAVRRVVLTRPAVEAGESLGFLPGDMKEKLDPYMQPLYDALRDMIPAERLAQFLENGTIEIAPLAFMRGRTLDRSFVILDEAQNTTPNQMKMFLTRMGPSSQFIVTGDPSQIDLPTKQASGLPHALKTLTDVEGIAHITLDGRDVVRHALVRKIIAAYDGQ